ncbi:hypothetical protein DID75_03955 [Candidatus Marinamargulisbacteria bacterium SCGC AG-410-N11]|nr:hypothetical protein DID75_03955 [Candidatus Marinamargulisbacteria bacterium SCGC AG-410-N11]
MKPLTPIEIDIVQQEKDQFIDSVLSLVKKNSLLKSFGKLFLESIPFHTLTQENISNLSLFISNRFDYLINSPIETGNFRIYPTVRQGKECHVLEVVFPDAPFHLMTIESIFKKYNIKINKLFHPVFSVKYSKLNKISSILPPIKKGVLISVIYLEFDFLQSANQLKNLELEIDKKIKAVQLSFNDSKSLLKTLISVKKEAAKNPTPLLHFHQEWVDLFDWLKNENFSLHGYCSFKVKTGSKPTVTFNSNSGLGILCPYFETSLHKMLTSHVKKMVNYRSPFIFDTINFLSPVQRFENLMRLSLKIPISKNTYIEHNFLGLLRRSSLLYKNLDTPIIRLKIQSIFKKSHVVKGSYNYNHILRLFNSIPKFELFRTPTDNLMEMTDHLFSIVNPNQLFCFTHRNIRPNQQFLMIVIPPQIFSDQNINIIIDYLRSSVKYKIREIIKIYGDPLSRLHIYFDINSSSNWRPNCHELELALRQLIMPWNERLRNCLHLKFDSKQAEILFKKYNQIFPNHHKVRRTPEETTLDIFHIESIYNHNCLQFNLVPFHFHDSHLNEKASILYIYWKEKIDLISIMPILQNLGIHVFDELTTRVGTKVNTLAYIHSFRIAHLNRKKINETKIRPLLLPLLEKIFSYSIKNDPINALVFSANTTWKQLILLQAYRNYLTQVIPSLAKENITQVFLKHPSISKLLVHYFETKFNYQNNAKVVKSKLNTLSSDFEQKLTQVDDISEDIILKHIFNIMKCTLRTNYFLIDEESIFPLSIKVNSPQLNLSTPLPYREIFVYDHEMEGIHIRFGPVSRGGLRWSNRLDDFRLEVLGLASTQQTKNVVIIPEGSKGGFVIKKQNILKKDIQSEAVIQYKKFIKGLLDITDSLNANEKPTINKKIVCYDDPDPYLVVAADKGTASFSDIANKVSKDRNFWLGDAFASGGSYGYNHKDEAITARGAWECVKIHFLEKGQDISSNPFTVIGVGDMSGDVFGNGLLLSQQSQLIAAFNHLHIFIDPNPDPKKSWKERQRLFNLDKSTWADYNSKVLSKGGEIFSRKSKSITLNKTIKELFNIKKNTITPNELIKIILQTKVDLLWFGGIGTYIKSSHESNFKVSDHANDAIRINADTCKASIIGEGANLAITPLARTKLSYQGTRLNTDFIDNSAGVNMSDYEVNLKILLSFLEKKKIITSIKKRNSILFDIVDNISELVLANNRAQHYLISKDLIRSKKSIYLYSALLNHLISKKVMVSDFDVFLVQQDLEHAKSEGTGLTRPIIALLQSYIKIIVYKELSHSSFISDPWLNSFFESYFPSLILKSFKDYIHSHSLKKEISATLLVNYITNQAGSYFYTSISEKTNLSYSKISQLYLIIDYALDCSKYRQAIHQLNIPKQDQYHLLIAIEDFIFNFIVDVSKLSILNLSFQDIATIKTILNSISQSETSSLLMQLSKKYKLEDSIVSFFIKLGSLNELPYLLFLNIIKKISPNTGNRIIHSLNDALFFSTMKLYIENYASNASYDFKYQDSLKDTLFTHKLSFISYIIKEVSPKELKSLTSKSVYSKLNHSFPTEFNLFLKSFSELSKPISLNQLNLTINQLNFLILNASIKF